MNKVDKFQDENPYEIFSLDEVIGCGAFGKVYKAVNK